MKIDPELARLAAEIERTKGRIKWLKKHRKKLEALPEASVYGSQIDFDNLPHAEVIKVIRTLGGKYKKSKNSQEGKIDYVGEVDGVTVRCWAGEPPPSCRMIEVEEYIPEKVIPAHVEPARTIKRLKMVCTPEPAAQIAIARQPQPSAQPV